MHGRAAIRVGIAAVAVLLTLPAVARADTVSVNTTADHNDKVCDAADCTLREAVELGANTINLPKASFKLDPELGELVLVNDHIIGAGARASIIDGSGATRVLRAGDGTSSIEGVTVTHGDGTSSVSNGSGGGIFVQSGATLDVTASTIDANASGVAASGGGISVAGSLVMDTSLVTGNTAAGRVPVGAGIVSTGSLILRNSTVSNNTATGSTSQGGGIASNGSLGLNGVTIANNTANAAAGLLEAFTVGAAPPPHILLNTIIGGNNGPECAGNGLDTDTTHNSLADDTTCALGDATDQPGVNPQLRGLANNGGPTNTHALLPTSPAINKGASCFGAIDQRNVVRPQGAACDIGAFEYRPHALNVVTHVVNDNGGTLTAAQVSVHVLVDGGDAKGSPAAGVEGGRQYALLTGDAYVVTADDVTGYALSYSSGCSAAIVEGGSNTCTVTVDDIAPKLTVITAVTNNNGGTSKASDFSTHVRQNGADVSGSPQPGSTGGTTYTLTPGSFSVSAEGVSGYTGTGSGGCALNGSVTLALGDIKTCTITADDVAPKLTVKTLVTNDNGGAKVPADFNVHVRSGGADVSGSPAAGTASGQQYTLNAGAYAVVADGLSGYTLSGPCSVTLAVGDDKTCTITADDVAPKLTVKTLVTNDNGGAKVPADFNVHVRSGGADVSGSPAAGTASGQQYTLNAGAYAVVADGLSGYTLSGPCSVTLAVGDDKTCTITANDIAPKLTVMTSVTNDDGGAKSPGDFSVHVRSGGTDVTNSPAAGTSAGKQYTLNAGSFVVAADGVSGYTLSGPCSVPLAVGDDKTCTITANDIAPTLTVVTELANNFGGTLAVGGVTTHVTGQSTDLADPGSATGTTHSLRAGRQYAVAADAVRGYSMLVADGCSAITLQLAENRTCKVTVRDVQPVLTVRVLVDDNGTGQNDPPDAFRVSITRGSTEVGSGSGNAAGQEFPLNAGSYAVAAEGRPGYSTEASDDCAPNGTLALAVGDRMTCTITKIAGSPTLQVVSAVVNDNGGSATVGAFTIHVRRGSDDVVGSPQLGNASGTDFLLPVGAYTVASSGPAGYRTTFSSGCSGGNVSLALGDAKTCTVTQDDVAPTLTVVTSVTNDNGGTATPAGFSVHVRSGGADVSGSPQAGSSSGTTYTLAAGGYAVSSDAVAGYTAAIAGACAADGSVALAVGDAKTCTVAADDDSVSSSALPPPVIHKSVNLLPSQGKVLIKPPGSKSFVAIDEGQQVPVGTVVDVRKGRVTLIAAADANGDTATAVFYGGIFKLGQTKAKTPITTLALVEKLTGCQAKGKATIAKKKVRKRRLWGDGKGHFRTEGKHSAATVVGTKWLVEDSCSSTLTKVARGIVSVRDFAKKKTVKVKAGHKYVARGR